jgi:hypothetical protein
VTDPCAKETREPGKPRALARLYADFITLLFAFCVVMLRFANRPRKTERVRIGPPRLEDNQFVSMAGIRGDVSTRARRR